MYTHYFRPIQFSFSHPLPIFKYKAHLHTCLWCSASVTLWMHSQSGNMPYVNIGRLTMCIHSAWRSELKISFTCLNKSGGTWEFSQQQVWAFFVVYCAVHIYRAHRSVQFTDSLNRSLHIIWRLFLFVFMLSFLFDHIQPCEWSAFSFRF